MNPSELMLEMAAFLAGDRELQSWCEGELGKGLSVYLGVDDDNPPPLEDYPTCCIVDVVEERGDNLPVQKFTVYISVSLINGNIDASKENMRIYSGLPQVADLKHRLEAACFRFRPGGVKAEGVAVPETLFPIFIGYSKIEYSLPKSTRRALR